MTPIDQSRAICVALPEAPIRRSYRSIAPKRLAALVREEG